MTTLRLSFKDLSATAYKGIVQAKTALDQGPLDNSIIELVNLRVSQINGCSYCTQMHSEELRQHGFENKKIDSVAGWRVSESFDDRERAALAWSESLTNVSVSAAPDEVYMPLNQYFCEAEISDLSIAVALMNALNRLAIGMRL